MDFSKSVFVCSIFYNFTKFFQIHALYIKVQNIQKFILPHSHKYNVHDYYLLQYFSILFYCNIKVVYILFLMLLQNICKTLIRIIHYLQRKEYFCDISMHVQYYYPLTFSCRYIFFK